VPIAEGGSITSRAKIDKYHLILEAAIRVFARYGYHRSTVAKIAREAGVADGTIYLYFKNKDDILVQFFQYKTKQVFERFREEVDRGGSAVEKLHNLVRRHLEEFQRDRDLAIVYQTETHRLGRRAEDQIKEMSKMYRDLIAGILERGQAEGRIRKDLPVGVVKRFIIGAVDEVINTWIHSSGGYDLVSMAQPLVDLFFNGIGSRGTSCRQCANKGDTPHGTANRGSARR
jgi:TetR/AcrR family fatty acid metabolism transcriptional regulator